MKMNFTETGVTGIQGGGGQQTGYAWYTITGADLETPAKFSDVSQNGAKVNFFHLRADGSDEDKLFTIESAHEVVDGEMRVIESFQPDKSAEDRAKNAGRVVANIIRLYQAAGYPTVLDKKGHLSLTQEVDMFADLVGKRVCLAVGGSLLSEAKDSGFVPKGASADAVKERCKALPNSGFPTALWIPTNAGEENYLKNKTSNGRDQSGWPLLGSATIDLAKCIVADPIEAQRRIDAGAKPTDNRKRPWFKTYADYDRKRKAGAMEGGNDASAGNGNGSDAGSDQPTAPVDMNGTF